MRFKRIFFSEWFNDDTLFFIQNDNISNRNTDLLKISAHSGNVQHMYTEADERFDIYTSNWFYIVFYFCVFLNNCFLNL